MSNELKDKKYTLHPAISAKNETLTLRDQFAMNSIAMAWSVVEAGCLDPDVNDMAKFAYQMADAMLNARSKQQ